MSQYKNCRTCGTDLIWTGEGFGARECCCNQGYCFTCCPGEEGESEKVTS